MANRRMLAKSISTSIEVNNLSLPARLLFTWMIPHADDDGRLKGDPKYIKATVVPYTNWSPNTIKSYLVVMNNIGLIHYWQDNSEWFIEFVKWKAYQQLRKDRYHASDLPSFSTDSVNQAVTSSQPSDSQVTPEANISESSTSEFKKGEYKEEVADKNIPIIDLKKFKPEDAGETAALEAFIALEPDNERAFTTTYYWAYKQGLPADLFYQFKSEIKQDKTIKKKGAVFRTKVEAYLQKRKKS